MFSKCTSVGCKLNTLLTGGGAPFNGDATNGHLTVTCQRILAFIRICCRGCNNEQVVFDFVVVSSFLLPVLHAVVDCSWLGTEKWIGRTHRVFVRRQQKIQVWITFRLHAFYWITDITSCTKLTSPLRGQSTVTLLHALRINYSQDTFYSE